MTFEIKIDPHNLSLSVPAESILSEALTKSDIPVSIYCHGRGLCGKCFVKIIDGPLPQPSENEARLLERKKLDLDHRLSCQYRVTGDMRIFIPDTSLFKDTPILETGPDLQIPIDPTVKKYVLQPMEGDIRSDAAFFKYISTTLSIENRNQIIRESEKVRSSFSQGHPVTAIVYEDSDLLKLESGDSNKELFGLALDIGTTTVVAKLIDLTTGRILGVESALNSQVKFGADVVSRISHAFFGKEQQKELQQAILDTLNGLILQLCQKSQINKDSVYEVVAAGNTVMNHLLLGKAIDTLAVSPFTPNFTSIPALDASSLGLDLIPKAKVYIAPNIQSFVGGDISAGLMASNFLSLDGIFLYLDLGTNGEIVLKTKEKTVTTSTAAGPAFEGMNISCGMLAFPGAISRIDNGRDLTLTTVGNKPPKGICGTGLIDMLAISLDRKDIANSGLILNPDKTIKITEGIVLTQKDIRELQLAIAAIKTGITMMLERNNLSEKDLEGIYLAGAFGNYLNVQNAIRIGLLPNIDTKKVTFLGNAAIAGARTLLLSQETKKTAEGLTQQIEFVSLAADPTFQDHFVSALEFK